MENILNKKPADWLQGLKENWETDALSGFIVSLVALPLCLGIAMASGVPPMAGIITGIIGGLLVSLLSGSYLTINGPAAGLAIIVLMSVEGFEKLAPTGLSPEERNLFAYQCTLAVGVGCGVIQLGFALIKAGVLSNFFPSSVVHGMMAAIGIMIFAKQFHTAVGVKPQGKEILEVIMEIPRSIQNMNPEIFIIAIISLVILIGLPFFKNKYIKMIPAPLLVILIAIPLGHYFDLEHEHKYTFFNSTYALNPKFLVSLPERVLDAIVFPRFDYLFTSFGIQMMITYSLVASLESLLTASAIDKIDPYKRHSNFNKELFAKGLGNILSSSIGGLPMIAEVVRSSANVNNGAKTRWSNFFHGLFLLIFVVILGTVIHQIPLAALAAMLMVTGYRLASPKEFLHMFHIGKEQLIIFVSTIIFTLATDLLIGIAVGILVKLIIHIINGVPLKNLFKPFLTITVDEEENNYTIDVQHSAIFSNYIGFKNQLDKLPRGKNITMDFTGAKLIDHTVMDKIETFAANYRLQGGSFNIIGLDGFKSFSKHALSARKKSLVK